MPMEDQPIHTWQSLRIQLSEDLRHSDNFKELLSMVPVQRFWVQNLLLQVVMTVDILVLQSTFNLRTIRCFLYLICYLGVAVDDTPQGGNV